MLCRQAMDGQTNRQEYLSDKQQDIRLNSFTS